MSPDEPQARDILLALMLRAPNREIRVDCLTLTAMDRDEWDLVRYHDPKEDEDVFWLERRPVALEVAAHEPHRLLAAPSHPGEGPE